MRNNTEMRIETSEARALKKRESITARRRLLSEINNVTVHGRPPRTTSGRLALQPSLHLGSLGEYNLTCKLNNDDGISVPPSDRGPRACALNVLMEETELVTGRRIEIAPNRIESRDRNRN
ncbi:hypothetical protein EVAR_48535_1 [Eumeta japonica]|uniref:Uncharacterized protein n=1 Tax=Eumeta variegata TaxID=151549 RepID=A0A4C1YAX4_EUMVA|nr:hypothetical protein EVAR_48535_1 [Eumeta japonica]